MVTRYKVYKNGWALHDVADSIYITDIQEMPAEMETVTQSIAGSDGSMLVAHKRTALQVRISFQIREYDVAKRREVLNDVLAWATIDGDLMIGDRPKQRLAATLDTTAALSSLKWTDTLTLSFTAWNAPFWISTSTDTLTLTAGTGDSHTITLEGNHICYPTIMMGNEGDTAINSISVKVGTNQINFTNLNMLPGGIIYIMPFSPCSGQLTMVMMDDNGTKHLNGNRTSSSADNLPIQGGKATAISFSADGTLSFYLYAQGVWL